MGFRYRIEFVSMYKIKINVIAFIINIDGYLI